MAASDRKCVVPIPGKCPLPPTRARNPACSFVPSLAGLGVLSSFPPVDWLMIYGAAQRGGPVLVILPGYPRFTRILPDSAGRESASRCPGVGGSNGRATRALAGNRATRHKPPGARDRDACRARPLPRARDRLACRRSSACRISCGRSSSRIAARRARRRHSVSDAGRACR